MTAISNNDIARAIHLVFKDSNLEVLPPLGGRTSKFAKIIQFLARRHLLPRASNILLELEKIINKEKGRVMAKVSNAKKLDHKTKMRIEEFLKKRYSAREIGLLEILDEKLLGGFKVEASNEIIDLSIKGEIGKLQEYLTRPA